MSSSVIAMELEKCLNEQFIKYNDICDHNYQTVLGLQQFELQGWKTTANSGINFQVIAYFVERCYYF